MQKMNFSKKRLSPIIEKYNIDVENDGMFREIVTIFDGQTDYQLWAIKLVYDGVCGIDTIKNIFDWASNNKSDIKNLSKGNIINYRTSDEIENIHKEIESIGVFNLIKNNIDKFNTCQRKMLHELILGKYDDKHFSMDTNDSFIKEWFSLLKSFSKLPSHKQHKIIVQASSMNNLDELINHVKSSIGETYVWDREELLEFIQRNITDSPVVYDKDNIVIVRVASYDSSKKLCGKGATSWCITKSPSYFDQYVGNKDNAAQYFMFNFNLPEQDELSHVGFTVDFSNGKITNAHSTQNNNLCCDFKYKGANVNIDSILVKNNVPSCTYFKINQLKNFEWSAEGITNFCEKNNIEIVCVMGSHIVVKPSNMTAVSKILNHTLIKTDKLSFNKETQLFIILNIDKQFNDDDAIIILNYGKDDYDTLSINNASNLYNRKVDIGSIFKTIGVDEEKLIGQQTIKPDMLLHKYIDQNRINDILDTISRYENIDVNTVYRCDVPLHKALSKGMIDVCEAIIKHKSFNFKTFDGFGEFFGTLVLYYRLNQNDRKINKLIDIILNTQDINTVNSCNETMLHVAVEHQSLIDIVQKLLENQNINPNIINEFGMSPLTNAIIANNIEAIELLLSRDDVVVRKCDFSVANEHKLDLQSIIDEKRKNKSEDNTSDIIESLKNILFEKLSI